MSFLEINKEELLNIKPIPEWDKDKKFSYEDTFLDYNDIDNLNQALIKVRLDLKYINKKLADVEKQRATIEVKYKRLYRREFINAEVPTESHRRLYAEMKCEDLEIQKIYADQMIEELRRVSFGLRTELDILIAIGHNLRREMKL